MFTWGTKAVDFKYVVRIDLQGHFQGQKAKNPTSLEQPNFGCSNEVPKFGCSHEVPKFGCSHEVPKLFITTSKIWINILESKKSLPFQIARRRYLRSGPCFTLIKWNSNHRLLNLILVVASQLAIAVSVWLMEASARIFLPWVSCRRYIAFVSLH